MRIKFALLWTFSIISHRKFRWQVTSLACSGLIYEEFSNFGRLQFILGGVGLGCNFLGVLLSSSRPLPGGYGYLTVELL